MSKVDELREKWAEVEPKYKYIIFGILAVVPVLFYVQSMRRAEFERETAAKQIEKKAATELAATAQQPGVQPSTAEVPGSFKFSALPASNRNMGLEDLSLKYEEAMRRLQILETNQPKPGVNNASGTSLPPDLKGTTPSPFDPASVKPPSLPPPVNFEPSKATLEGSPASAAPQIKKSQSSPAMQVWASEKPAPQEVAPMPKLMIPVNSGFEAVMLTGVYARPSGSVGGAMGSTQSANTIGAPFVTRVKGSAILPNSWRVADISDCFLGGSAVANLSAERATVIANKLSCVSAAGDVYEASIKAYGVDIDGIQGLAGKVVSKQGAVLGQAFLVGIASGLGSALSPTAIPGYNSSATGGSTQYQQPNPSVIAQTAVGQGLHTAAAQLSKFYLDFARELFPVVEVVSGTRVTWILLESAELTKNKL